jgi:hypothetical protein
MKDTGVGGAEGYLSPTVTFSSTWNICFPYARPLVKKHISDAIKNECVIVYHCSYCKTESTTSGTTLPAT